jgi:hypothetical protein
MKAELAQLKSEVATLKRTEDILRSRDEKLEQLIQDCMFHNTLLLT